MAHWTPFPGEIPRRLTLPRATYAAPIDDRPKQRVQSFSSAVHPLCRLTDSQVALFFRAEDGRIALLGSAKLSRSYPGVDSKGTYRNGERL